ncbi:hypothetical protein EYF80_001233 [Liparis tanakae]|uniref:Uncharacterized protein n=1 Tax=Liparis tanakae TaxID=230148 RepID=A0A4Z2JEL6_9TELE|nr:hypothetical protein EYF80_001233 [Liparis tanakae]
MVIRKGRQRSGGRTSMQRFFSWFRGSRAMLQSSTRSVGVTMFRVCRGGGKQKYVPSRQRLEASVGGPCSSGAAVGPELVYRSWRTSVWTMLTLRERSSLTQL